MFVCFTHVSRSRFLIISGFESGRLWFQNQAVGVRCVAKKTLLTYIGNVLIFVSCFCVFYKIRGTNFDDFLVPWNSLEISSFLMAVWGRHKTEAAPLQQ